jgi:hypothetical protein
MQKNIILIAKIEFKLHATSIFLTTRWYWSFWLLQVIKICELTILSSFQCILIGSLLIYNQKNGWMKKIKWMRVIEEQRMRSTRFLTFMHLGVKRFPSKKFMYDYKLYQKGDLMWSTLFWYSTLIWYTWIGVFWFLEKYRSIWGLERVKIWIVHGVDHQGNEILINCWIQRLETWLLKLPLYLVIVWRHM